MRNDSKKISDESDQGVGERCDVDDVADLNDKLAVQLALLVHPLAVTLGSAPRCAAGANGGPAVRAHASSRRRGLRPSTAPTAHRLVGGARGGPGAVAI